MSKSCTEQSRKMPPEAAMYAAGGVQLAQLAALHGGPGVDETGVEAAVVADLDRHVAALDGPEDLDALAHVLGDGLLAEDGDAGLDAGQDQLGVGVRRRRDHDAVHAGGQQGLGRVHDLAAEALRGGLGGLREGVGEHERLDGVESGEGLGVEGADAAEAEDSDAHGGAAP
jgi:hypothetical protein